MKAGLFLVVAFVLCASASAQCGVTSFQTPCCTSQTGRIFSCFPHWPNRFPSGPYSNIRSTLYPFGPVFGDTAFGRNDDTSMIFDTVAGSSYGSFDLKDLVWNFYGVSYTRVVLNNNGLISFVSAISSWNGTPFPLNLGPLIAGYWQDVDTRGGGGQAWFRLVRETAPLRNISADVSGSYLGASSFRATHAFVATWDAVCVYPSDCSRGYNTFQIVLATDGVQNYCLLNYGLLAQNWLQGTASSVDPQVGFDAGDRTNYLQGPYSRTPNMRNLWNTTNTYDGLRGRLIYRIDSAVIASSPDSLSTNAKLAGLVVSTQYLIPAFNASNFDYTVYLPLNSLFSVNATVQDPTASLKVDSASATSGVFAAPITYTQPISVIVTVIPQDPNALVNAYRIRLLTLLDPNPKLSSIVIKRPDSSALTFDQGAFSPVIYTYTLRVDSTVRSISFDSTTQHPNARITMGIYGPAYATLSANNYPLTYGGITYLVFVGTSENGLVTQSYSVNITMTLSSVATLANITNAGNYPVTVVGSTYSFTAANTDSTVMVTATAVTPGASVRINGGASSQGSSSTPVPLNVFGLNSFSVVVTAENGATFLTYTVLITRPLSPNNSLSLISVRADSGRFLSLSPIYYLGTTAYSVMADPWTSSVQLTASLVDPLYASMTLNGVSLGDNVPSAFQTLNSNPDSNTNTVFSIAVTAQNGQIRTYVITVTKPALTSIAAVPACTAYNSALLRTEVRSIRITMASGEFLHVGAVTNVTGAAPRLWLRRSLMPDTAQGSGYDANDRISAGDSYSSATLAFAPTTSNYYLTYAPSTSDSSSAYMVTFQICSYVANTVSLNTNFSSTINRNGWAFFQYTTLGTQYFASTEWTLYPTTPHANSLQLLRPSARPAAGTNVTEALQWFPTAASPLAGTNVYVTSSTTPGPTTRVVLGVFAAGNVAGVQSSYGVRVLVRPPQPVITQVSPLVGGTAGGTRITIQGTGFDVGTLVATGSATIGGGACTNLAYDAQGRVLCDSPAGEGANLPVSLTLNGRAAPTYGLTFSYFPPALTSITPGNGPTLGNNSVVIVGTNIGPSATVLFGSSSAVVIARSVLGTSITALVPSGQGIVQVSVISGGQTSSNTLTFTYDVPVPTSLSAANRAGQGGNPVTIYGSNFGTPSASVSVTIGGNNCPVLSWAHGNITCTIPSGSGLSQLVVVTVSGRLSSSALYFNYDGPTILSITPNPVPVNATLLTIRGTSFGPSAVAVAVSLLGGSCTSISNKNDTYLTCIPPSRSAGSPAAATISLGGQSSSPFALNWASPTLTARQPARVRTVGGDRLLVTGYNIAGPDVQVSLSGVTASLVSANSTAAVVSVPAGQGTMIPIVLTVGGLSSNILTVNYSIPSLTSITFTTGGVGASNPSTDGTSIATINGDNLGTSGTVFVDSFTCANPSWSHTLITCTFPASAGSVSVRVVVAGQTSNSLAVVYAAPTISGLSPSTIPTDGSVALTINGNNFGTNQGSSSVTVANIACSPVTWSPIRIVCLPPAGRGTGLLVRVSISGQNATTSTFNYAPPSISSINALSFPTSGGVLLSIFGSSFDIGGTVRVDNKACNVYTWSHTAIQCWLPADSGINRPVQIFTTVVNATNATPFPLTYNGPTIQSSSPNSLGVAGSTVTLNGLNFGVIGETSVTVGGLGGHTLVKCNHTILIFTLAFTPSSASNPVVVIVSGQSSAPVVLGVASPSLTSIFPTTGPTGPAYNLTITGNSFGDGTQTSSVALGSTDCPIVTINATRIVCTVPNGVDTQPVKVTIGSQASNTLNFQYNAPVISTLSSTTGFDSAGRSWLLLTGTSFGTAPTVTVGSSVATINSNSHTSINITVPAGLGSSVSVTVRVGTQTSAARTISYETPVLTSISPTIGATLGGVVMTLNGRGFGPQSLAAASVTIGSTNCPVDTATYTANQIRCTIPAGSGANLAVRVRVQSVDSNSLLFNYTSATLSSASPSGATTAGGTVVVLLGSNFGPSIGTVNVVGSFGSGQCSITLPQNWQDNSITCVMPAGAGVVSISVTASGQTSNSISYSYGAPTITAISPANGPTLGGIAVTVTGTNLYLPSAGSLTIGGFTCSPTGTGWSHTRVECLLPAGVGNYANVSVSVVGVVATRNNFFLYDPPAVLAVTPSFGPTNALVGGNPASPLTIIGTNFGSAGATVSVTVGGNPCSISSRNHTVVVCSSVPNGVDTLRPVVVTVQGAPSPAQSLFSYLPPTISAISGCDASVPLTSNCPTAGGVNITLSGTYFGPSGSSISISVAGKSCDGVERLNLAGTSIRCKLPTGYGYNQPVTVTVGGQTSQPALISYAVPVLQQNTLRLDGQPMVSGGNMTRSDIVNGTVIVQMNGTFLAPAGMIGTPWVRYGTAANNYREFNCTVLSFSNTDFRCSLQQISLGRNLQFVYSDGSQESRPSSDFISFGQPQLVAGTIHSDSATSQTSNTYTGSSSQGEFIRFSARNVGNTASFIKVYYDLPGGTFDRECTSVSISTPYNSLTGITELRCRTQADKGQGYVFMVAVLGYRSPAGSDTFNYPQSPVIYSVSGSVGCVNVSGTNTTRDCPTSGGVLITVIGKSFSSSLNSTFVKVGTGDCVVRQATQDANTGDRLVCTLPAGTGIDVAVTVYANSLISQPAYLLSYAYAQITAVSGCTDSGSSTVDCNRVGGSTLTLTGTNFGASSAQIFVGASICTAPTHDSSTPHTRVTCTLPAGSSLGARVLLIQGSGVLSATVGTLSYSQCSAGKYQANSTDYACTPCSPGYYTDVAGLQTCKPCIAGTYASASSASSCDVCAAGTISSAAARNCTQCPAGSYVSDNGQATCLQCPAGSFSAVAGSDACTQCPAGTQSSVVGATACSNCIRGTFSALSGQLQCTLCAVGSFTNGTGLSTCTSCIPGTVQPYTGGTACTACTAGSAIGSSNQPRCSTCSPGSFARDSGATACQTCQAGAVSGLGATACSNCTAGYYIGSAGQATCLPCGRGFYSNVNGATACTPCTAGAISTVSAATTCSNCTAGFYASTSGQDACVKCPLGTFSPFTGMSYCVSCSQGKYGSDQGLTVCTDCAAGSANDLTGQPSCPKCLPGTYQNQNGQTACLQCAVGSAAPSVGASSCTSCAAGSFAASLGSAVCSLCADGKYASSANSGACLDCPIGSYSGQGAGNCTTCPLGQYSGTVGSLACFACPIGSFANSTGLPACFPCSPGSWSNGTGLSYCTLCSAGSFARDFGQASCISCPPGFIAPNPGSSSCQPCAIGFAQPLSGQTTCQACERGQAIGSVGQAFCSSCAVGAAINFTAQDSCADCPTGFYTSSSGQAVCSSCAAGTFASGSRSFTCQLCPEGFFQPSTGQSSCRACPVGTSQSSSGRTLCNDCGAGFFSAAIGQASCTACPAGSFSISANATACLTCSAGRYNPDLGKSECLTCDAGTASAAGSLRCLDCPPGTVANNTGNPSCTQCDPGSFQLQSRQQSCTLCAPGTATGDFAQTSCANCTAGTYQPNSGQTQCQPCTGGYYCPEGSRNPIACSPGSFTAGPRQSQCAVCGAGTFNNVSAASSCQSCPVGSYSGAGATVCTQCAAGTFAQIVGSQSCYPCAAGWYSGAAGASTCFICLEGTSSSSGSSQCSQCAPGTFGPVAGLVECLSCAAGSYSSGYGNTTCTQCPMGSVQSAGGQSSCKACELGQYVGAVGQAVCLECDAGLFSNQTGLTACYACPRGSFSSRTNGLGAQSCSLCEKGKFAINPGQPACQPCAPGSSTNDLLGQPQCSPCQSGRFSNTTGMPSCTACPTGSFVASAGALTCLACNPGSFQDLSGTTACKQCEPGSFSNTAGAQQCTSCDVGFYSSVPGMVQCDPCPLGRFADTPSQPTCTECDEGSYGPSTQLQTCTLCPVGRYQSSKGRPDCIDCAAGTFQDEQGKTLCKSCPLGSYQSGVAKTSCEWCDPGSYNGAVTQSACLACSAGTYMPTNASITPCISCSIGSYQAFSGQSTCMNCSVGSIAPSAGLTSCEKCPVGRYRDLTTSQCVFCGAGTYQNQEGMAACEPCTNGTYAQGAGNTACTSCPSGRFTDQSGANECRDCPLGKYQDASARTFCLDCGQGMYNMLKGASACASCEAGTFSNSTGRESACDPCPVGSNQISTGATICNLCVEGKYNERTGLSAACTLCSDGQYSTARGATGCLTCPVGTTSSPNKLSCPPCGPKYFSATNGSSVCQSCPPGTANADSGRTSCDACKPGSYAPGFATDECLPCQPRFGQASSGRTTCDRCQPGHFSNQTGISDCFPCPLGSYQSVDAQTSCVACPTGTFQNNMARSACDVCAPGTFNDNTGQTVCLRCSAGSYSAQAQSTTCSLCQAGFFSVTGSSVCNQCGPRQVAPVAAASTCYACDVNAEADESHVKCMCNIGYAGQVTNDTSISGYMVVACTPCPRGAVCEKPGTMWDTMLVQNGYWRAAPGVYYRCLLETYCTGGDNQCQANRVGPLCGYCKEGFTEALDGTCNLCGPQENSIIYTILIIVGFIIILFILFAIMLYSGASIMDMAAREDAKIQRVRDGFVENFNEGYMEDQWRHGRILRYTGPPAPKPDFTFKLKIALTFVQIITNLSVGLEIQWPTAFKSFINWLNPANLDFVKFSSVDCIRRATYYEKVAVTAVSPIVLLVAVFVFYFIPFTCKKLSRDDEGRAWRKRVRRNFWKLSFFALFLVYPGVSSVILRLYVCKNIEGTSYLLADLREVCYTDTWNRAAYAGGLLILLYPVGIPLFFFVMLYRYARKGRLDQSGIRAELGFLYDAYERSFYLFELVDTAHKLLLLGVVPFVPFDWQLNAAMILVTLYTMIIFVGKPYLRKADDRLHLVAQIELLLLLMAGNNFNKASSYDSLMDKVLSVVLIAGVVLFFAYFVVTFFGNALKMCRDTECGKKMGWLQKKPKAGKGGKGVKGGESIEDENRRVYRIDRADMRQKGKIATQRGGAQAEDDGIQMQRSALFARADSGAVASPAPSVRRASLVALMEGTLQKPNDVEMSTFSSSHADAQQSPVQPVSVVVASPVDAEPMPLIGSAPGVVAVPLVPTSLAFEPLAIDQALTPAADDATSEPAPAPVPVAVPIAHFEPVMALPVPLPPAPGADASPPAEPVMALPVPLLPAPEPAPVEPVPAAEPIPAAIAPATELTDAPPPPEDDDA